MERRFSGAELRRKDLLSNASSLLVISCSTSLIILHNAGLLDVDPNVVIGLHFADISCASVNLINRRNFSSNKVNLNKLDWHIRDGVNEYAVPEPEGFRARKRLVNEIYDAQPRVKEELERIITEREVGD